MTATRDVGAVLLDCVASAVGWVVITSLMNQSFSWHQELGGGISFGLASALYVAWQRFRARKEPKPVRWGRVLRSGRLPGDARGCAALARHVDQEQRDARPFWLTALSFVGVAAAVLGWALAAGGTHRLVAGTVFAAVMVLVVIREYVWLRQLTRMDQLLKTVQPTREQVSW